MKTVLTFPAVLGENDLNAQQILGAIRVYIGNFHFTTHIEDAVGEGAEQLFAYEKDRQVLTFDDLLALLTDHIQLIDGTIKAIEANFVLRAVDGTAWDIESDNPALVGRIKVLYPSATDVSKYFY